MDGHGGDSFYGDIRKLGIGLDGYMQQKKSSISFVQKNLWVVEFSENDSPSINP